MIIFSILLLYLPESLIFLENAWYRKKMDFQ